MKKFFLILFFGCIFYGHGQMIKKTNSNEYETVKIGDQLWMAENLKVLNFKDGYEIKRCFTSNDWKEAYKNKKPAWCYYKYNDNDNQKYGVLYNWYAVIDPRGLAPDGWEIPDNNDWEKLNNFLNDDQANKLKSEKDWMIFKGFKECNKCKGWDPKKKAGKDVCDKCNDSRIIKDKKSYNGNNKSGFNALPGGCINSSGKFILLQFQGFWWSLSESEKYNANYFSLSLDSESLEKNTNLKGFGYSVRCIKKQ